MPSANIAVELGKTGLKVTRLGLGTAPLGGPPTAPDTDEQAIMTVREALGRGLRLIDTAPLYGAGRSERLLAAALREIPREQYVLSTKVGRRITADGKVVNDWTRDGILRGIDESLERLGLDAVDLLLIHDADNNYREALDVVFPALAELRDQGIIRGIGAGMNQWQMPLEFAKNADFDCFLLAGRYTLLEQEPAAEFLPYCQEHNVGVILGGVLNSGILAIGARQGATYNYAAAPPAIMQRVAQMEAVCARYNVELRVAALQFPLAHPAVTTMVIGARSADEVEANIAGLAAPIPADLWSDLQAAGLIADGVPVPR